MVAWNELPLNQSPLQVEAYFQTKGKLGVAAGEAVLRCCWQ
jgi:hypothetical protein